MTKTTKKDQKRVAIYARVASSGVVAERSLARQLDEIRKHAKEKGHMVFKEYCDVGISGGTENRPALDQLRKDANRGCFEEVLLQTSERLARGYPLMALFLDELEERGISCVSVAKPVSLLCIGIQEEDLAGMQEGLPFKHPGRYEANRAKNE